MGECLIAKGSGGSEKATKILDSATGLDKTGGFKVVLENGGTNLIKKVGNAYEISSSGGSTSQGTYFRFTSNYEGVILCKAIVNSLNYKQLRGQDVKHNNDPIFWQTPTDSRFTGSEMYFLLSNDNYFTYLMMSTGGTNKITITEAWAIGKLQ